MKKKLLGIVLCVMLSISCVGCGKSYQEAKNTEYNEDYGGGYFTLLTTWNSGETNYCIVYANDTNVKYLICINGYKYGITPLYNSDGTLQIYDGK